jgi:hypothetical protein
MGKNIPPRTQIPKGSMSDIDRPLGGQKPGPMPKVYNTTPTATSTSTPSASSVSQTPAFLSRLHPSLPVSMDREVSPPTTPKSTPKGSTPAHLSRTHLFPSPLPPSLQQSHIANTSSRADRFLHNVPFEEEAEDPIPTEAWLAHNPYAPSRTPGLTSTRGWLQNIRIKQQNQYKEQSWRLEQLPMVFDALVSHSEQLHTVRKLICSNTTTMSGPTPALDAQLWIGCPHPVSIPLTFVRVSFDYTLPIRQTLS